MGRTEIGDIIDEIVTLERAITGTRVAYAESPESIATAPAWLNYPKSGTFTAMTSTCAEDTHTIFCACVKRGAMKRTDEQLMRPMITRFPDTLHENTTLNGTVAHISGITYEYGFIDILSTDEDFFFGIVFEVSVVVKDTITVSA